MKKIIFIFLIIGIVISIYLTTQDNKIYYLALGDDLSLLKGENRLNIDGFPKYINNYLKSRNKLEKTVVEYAKLNYRTTDLYNDINNNIKRKLNNEDVSIKNAIIKADLITLSIGINDFINYVNDYKLIKENIINLKHDMTILLESIRKISKENIILIGIYNPNPMDYNLNIVLKELNRQYENLCSKYDIYYLNIFDQMGKDINIYNNFPNEKGYILISNNLINYLEDVII